MPANLTPDYERAEARLRQATTDEERLTALHEMFATIPKHKGTEKMQADLKRRISQFRKTIAKKPAKGTDPFHVPRSGAGQVVLIGPPNVGKSRLVGRLTHAPVKVADYPFTTVVPCPGMFAAVAYAGLELVLWNHLGGYLLGYAFLLLALIAARKVVLRGPSAYRRWLPVYALAILLSMGFYELAVGVSLLVPLYFWWCLRRRSDASRLPWLAASLLPVLLYAGLYTWRAFQAERLFWVDPHEVELGTPPPWLFRCIQMLWGWLLQTVDIWRNNLICLFDARLGIEPSRYAWSWVACAVYGTAGMLLALTLRSPASRQRLRRESPFLVLVVLTVLGYAGMNCLGRTYTNLVAYYRYLFCVLGVVILFTAVDLAHVHRGLQWIAVAGLLALLGFNAAHTYRTSRLIGTLNTDTAAYFQAIERFVAAHREEPDFSFAVRDPSPIFDAPYEACRGYPSRHAITQKLPMSALLFTRYYNPWNPKYRLDLPTLPGSAGGQGLSQEEAEARWYRKAAEGGDALGMNNLGMMYEAGRGVAKDAVEAVKWYRRAAEGGDALGMNNLGTMYQEGRGVARDEAQAVRWYRRAADLGDEKAMQILRQREPGPALGR